MTDVFNFVFEFFKNISSFFTALYEFLFTSISIGKIELFGWVITEGLTFSVWSLMCGVGLVAFLVWGVLK